MSIAEKLTQIAENEQRVFDAGYEKGKSEGGGDKTQIEVAVRNDGSIRFKNDENGNFTMPDFVTRCGTTYEYTLIDCDTLNMNQVSFIGTYPFKGAIVRKMVLPLERYTNLGYGFFDATVEELVFGFTSGVALSANSFIYGTGLKVLTVPDGFACDLYLSKSTNWTTEALHNIIDKLADLTGKTAGVFKVGEENLAKISTEYIAKLENKNWNFS